MVRKKIAFQDNIYSNNDAVNDYLQQMKQK